MNSISSMILLLIIIMIVIGPRARLASTPRAHAVGAMEPLASTPDPQRRVPNTSALTCGNQTAAENGDIVHMNVTRGRICLGSDLRKQRRPRAESARSDTFDVAAMHPLGMARGNLNRLASGLERANSHCETRISPSIGRLGPRSGKQ